MNTLPSPATMVPNPSYETTRFNALRHGVLSRHTVLPWEDRSEYQALLDALVAEHAPDGRPKNTSSRNLLGSSGGNGECAWRRQLCIGRDCATMPPAITHQSAW